LENQRGHYIYVTSKQLNTKDIYEHSNIIFTLHHDSRNIFPI
jgi:hypothetical protein